MRCEFSLSSWELKKSPLYYVECREVSLSSRERADILWRWVLTLFDLVRSKKENIRFWKSYHRSPRADRFASSSRIAARRPFGVSFRTLLVDVTIMRSMSASFQGLCRSVFDLQENLNYIEGNRTLDLPTMAQCYECYEGCFFVLLSFRTTIRNPSVVGIEERCWIKPVCRQSRFSMTFYPSVESVFFSSGSYQSTY